MKKYTFLPIILTLIAFLPSSSEARRPGSYQDIKVPELRWELPNHTDFALENGIAGFVVEDHEVPLVDFELLFSAPPDPAEQVGLYQIAAWALRNGGAITLPADSLNDLIEFKGANLWISGGQDNIFIAVTCLTEDLPLMLSIVEQLVSQPAYPQDKIELKKSTMQEELRRRNDQPSEIARREIYRLLYQNHPWGRDASLATIDAITRNDILSYHQTVFQPEGAVIGFTGDLNSETARDLSARYLSGLKKRGGQIAKVPPVGEPSEPGVYYAFKDVNQAYIMTGHLTIDYFDPRRPASDMMNYILGGGSFQSILTKKIRIDAGLAYSVGSRFTTPTDGIGVFRVGASTRLDQSGRTLELMREVISQFALKGPTPEEFEAARQAFLNSYIWQYETSSDILGQLVYYKWKGLPLDTPQRDLDAYQKMTLEDVRKVASELLHPDSLITVVVGDKAKMDRPLEDFGRVHNLDLNAE